MLRSLFILTIIACGMGAALRNRFAALLLYVWFALFRPQEWVWIDITSLRLSLMLALLLFIPSFITGVLPTVTHPVSVAMVGFLCSALLAQLSAVAPDIGWQWIDFAARLFLTCSLLITLVSDERRLTLVLAVISGSIGFHSAKAGLAWIAGGGGMRFGDGLAGAFVDSNGYALATVMIMPLLVATAQNLHLVYAGRFLKHGRLALYGATGLCVFAIIGTYSRGGFLALCASALMYMLLQRRRFTALIAMAAVVGAILLLVPIPDSYLQRLQTIQTYETVGDDSALSRQHFWRVGIRMALERPLGIGLRQYEQAYDQYDFLYGRYGRKRAVHSSHVEVLAEVGFVGAVVWTCVFAYAFFACARVRARSRLEHLDPRTGAFLLTAANGLITSMTAFLVGGSFLSAALNDITWLTFAMVAALDLISERLCEAPVAQPALSRAEPPLAFRVAESYAGFKGARS